MNRACATVVLVLASAGGAAAEEVVFAEGFEIGGSCGWSGVQGAGTVRDFCVQTPSITVAPGEAALYCYYFRTPNTETVGVREWSSVLDDGTSYALTYATRNAQNQPAEREPPGTLTAGNCGIADEGGSGTTPGYVYGAHDPVAALTMPADDGAGRPLAMELVVDQPLFLEMLVFNSGGAPIQTRALVSADAYDPEVAYTRTETYLTYNASLFLPPNSSGQVREQDCAVPVGAEFWRLSTETHDHATEARIDDGLATLVTTTDWAHPNAAIFAAPSFYSFASGELRYRCTYTNATGQTITTGNDYSDEICVGVGYYFPAERPLLCVNDVGPL